jgi:hypothetical protein
MSTHAMVAGVTWPKLGSNEQERTELVEILVFSLCFDYGPAVESHSLDCVADRPSCKTCSFQHSVLSHVSASQDPQQGPPARQWRLASHASSTRAESFAPGFGDPGAKLFIVGLVPGAHGSNRMGAHSRVTDRSIRTIACCTKQVSPTNPGANTATTAYASRTHGSPPQWAACGLPKSRRLNGSKAVAHSSNTN